MIMKKKTDKVKKTDKAVAGVAVLPPRSTDPVREAGFPPSGPPLTKVKFRRQDGMFSPAHGVYELPEKQAAKFVTQGSAEYVDKRRTPKDED